MHLNLEHLDRNIDKIIKENKKSLEHKGLGTMGVILQYQQFYELLKNSLELIGKKDEIENIMIENREYLQKFKMV
jgi:hypothetical protein